MLPFLCSCSCDDVLAAGIFLMIRQLAAFKEDISNYQVSKVSLTTLVP